MGYRTGRARPGSHATILLELSCPCCGSYWDIEQGAPDIDARELANGAISLSCPTCKEDLAVVSNA